MTTPRPAREIRPARADLPTIEIHRSPKRRRSASARVNGTGVVVRVPADIDAEEEALMIERLVAKVTGRVRAERMGGDAALAARAAALADRYLEGVRPTEVRWSSRMQYRMGSCSWGTGRIRVSQQLATMPGYVLDHVLVHELAHLLVPDHSPSFHALVARHPETERAKGFLEGFSAGQLAAGIPDAAAPSEGSGDR